MGYDSWVTQGSSHRCPDCGSTWHDFEGGCTNPRCHGDESRRSDETIKAVTARKARDDSYGNEVRPGDRVVVTSWFNYEVDGPRTGYCRSERRVRKGPAWTPAPF